MVNRDRVSEPAPTAGGAPTGSGVPCTPVLARLLTTGPDDTRAAAAELATVLVDGDLLVLTGDLGAGKTCFTQGLGRGLGIEDRLTSPTFTLANRYRGRLLLHHLDVYRLDSVAETVDLGLAELLEDGVTVIEWGDRIAEVLPHDHLVVAIRYPELGTELTRPTERGSGAAAETGDIDWDGAAMSQRIIELATAAGAPSGWADRDLDRLLAPWRADR